MTMYPQKTEGLKVESKPLETLEALRRRLASMPNRMVLLTAITNEHGELIGFVVHSVGKVERVRVAS